MLKVLLVDDEPFILKGLAMIIDWGGEGFEIAGKVSNGLEALDFLRREKIDLVIADIKMPEMTGLELLEKVREEKLSDAYFVMLSGYSDFDYVRAALQNGCLDYMLKPVEQEELIKMLGKVREACEASGRKREDDSVMVRSQADFDPGEGDGLNLSEYLLDKQLVDSLIRAVKFNDKEGIRSGCEALFQGIEEKRLDAHMINMVVNHLMFEFLHLAQEQDENTDQEALRFINESVAGQINRNDREGIVRVLSEYGDYLMQMRSHQSGDVLRQIEEDIRVHFRENLTLKDMGKKYFINSAYLGQTFKKQYGESFKDYLNRVRIEAAEELLLYSNKKIYEVAEEVGYKDMDYFINKFIALKGCTPAKFRRQVK